MFAIMEKQEHEQPNDWLVVLHMSDNGQNSICTNVISVHDCFAVVVSCLRDSIESTRIMMYVRKQRLTLMTRISSAIIDDANSKRCSRQQSQGLL